MPGTVCSWPGNACRWWVLGARFIGPSVAGIWVGAACCLFSVQFFSRRRPDIGALVCHNYPSMGASRPDVKGT